jgi:hypothetical protein
MAAAAFSGMLITTYDNACYHKWER